MNQKNSIPIYNGVELLGYKNINCPYYENCLDIHFKNESNLWTCNDCKYKNYSIDYDGILNQYKHFVYYECVSILKEAFSKQENPYFENIETKT